MKLLCIVLLALSAVTINSSPTCSDFDIEKKCNLYQPSDNIAFPTTEDDLDEMCKSTFPFWECLIKESERCPDTMNGKMIEQYRGQKDNVALLCTKGSEFRTKLLKNANCLKEIDGIIGLKCESVVGLQFPHCERFLLLAGCIYSQYYEKCGKDASDLMQIVQQPSMRHMKKICLKEENWKSNLLRSIFRVPISF